ncbi:MAG: carbohydrate ABC transporter permease [Chloroflexota bacterium]|nr:carbohydrate ABC transporter permease [Chloroflexota bacterium]
METPHPLLQAAKAILLAIIGFLMIFPFVYVLAVSFSSYEDVVGRGLIIFPANPTLDAYRTVLEGGVVTRAVMVSAGLTLCGTAINLFMTVTLAYALSRTSVAGSRFVLIVVLLTFLFQPGLIPRFLLVKELGLLDTYASLILPGMISAFNLVVIRNFFMNIPQELLDSARMDGANDLRVLWDVVLPLSKAVLAVIALFYGVAIWNIFFDAVLYLNDTDKWPIQLILNQYVVQGNPMSQGQVRVNTPPETIRMAVLVIATVPILLVYPFLQRYFTRGVLTGAIKG